MDETFADLSILGDLGLENTDDVMPFVHSLSGQPNTITGQLVVPAFGGGTCNSEYEFLTSNSYAFFKSGSYPMLQYVHNNTESMASVLKQQGYNTIGMHPYYGSGWARNKAYPLMGFDKFLDIDSFDDATTKYLRRYVSDESWTRSTRSSTCTTRTRSSPTIRCSCSTSRFRITAATTRYMTIFRKT